MFNVVSSAVSPIQYCLTSPSYFASFFLAVLDSE